MSEPRVEYVRRLRTVNGEIARGERLQLWISRLRLTIVGVAALVVLAIVRGPISSWWLAVPAVLFAALVVIDRRVVQFTDRALVVRRLYERGVARIDGTWQGTGRDGAQFLEGHPYARDLDLFGPSSLFQLLNTTRTEIGESTLGDWVRTGAGLEEIRARQSSVDELRPMLDFRQAIAVAGTGPSIVKTTALVAWAKSQPAALPPGAGLMFCACSVVAALLTIAVYTLGFNLDLLIAWVTVQSILAQVWRRRVQHVLGSADSAASDLSRLSWLIARVEREPFTSRPLAAMSDALAISGAPPSRRIAALERLIAILDSSHNLLLRPIAALLLVRSQVAVAIERWRAAYGPSLATWLQAVGELEALSALATYAYEHPADPFPALEDGEGLLEADGLAHPLIADEVAVRNDLHLGGAGPRALVVSGSNMSGKSTLLRAVGVNVVLALAGAPVRATRFKVSRLALGTTITIEDSLQTGHSRFYEEILRIRAIVDLARGAVPVLFLFDEILGGTNSDDRRIGSQAIIRALIDRGAIGLATTHDRALTELGARFAPAVANVRFEDRIENGKMVFDYHMRPGVVSRSNALELMRAVGLDV